MITRVVRRIEAEAEASYVRQTHILQSQRKEGKSHDARLEDGSWKGKGHVAVRVYQPLLLSVWHTTAVVYLELRVYHQAI